MIAEAGVNHEGDLGVAIEQIRAVSRSGAQAIKFQYYIADLIASRDHSPAYWDLSKEQTLSQHELFRKYDKFNFEDYKMLKSVCDDEGIAFLCTAFDLDTLETLDPLVDMHKVASADITNVPLLELVASKGKPVILSTGAAREDEIDAAIGILQKANLEIALLHCVLNYPTPADQASLGRISTLIQKYGDIATIGYSDHVAVSRAGQVDSLQIAWSHGARVLEKHFTLDKSKLGNDHYHSADEEDLTGFMQWITNAIQMSKVSDDFLDKQHMARQNARRRIFSKRDLPAGHKITTEDLILLRADRGIEAADYWDCVGSILARGIIANSPIYNDELRI